MSTIGEVFARCREEGRAAFIPFLVAGHPSLQETGRLLTALAAGGADIIEVGVPFSDPIADGPVIQRASTHALQRAVTLSSVLELIATKRDALGVPIVLFSYFNPIHARGIQSFAEQAGASGVDGVICVDLPAEEGERELVPALAAQGVDTIFLLAPTSDRQRIERVAEAGTGFLYYVSTTGVTGTRDRLPDELLKEVRWLKRRVSLPVAVGFGISTPEQVGEVAKVADGVVVGSALVRLVEEGLEDPELAARVEERVRELVAPLHAERPKRWGWGR